MTMGKRNICTGMLVTCSLNSVIYGTSELQSKRGREVDRDDELNEKGREWQMIE